MLNQGDTWTEIQDRTLRGLHLVSATCTFGHPELVACWAQQLYFDGASIKGVWPALAHSLGLLHWHSNLVSLSKALTLISIIDSSSFMRLEVNPSAFLEWLHLKALGDCVLLQDSLVSLGGCRAPRPLGAARIVERRKVLVFGSDRGDCEGFLTFLRRSAKRYSSGLLVACVILILCWLCGTRLWVRRVMPKPASEWITTTGTSLPASKWTSVKNHCVISCHRDSIVINCLHLVIVSFLNTAV
jgi:hypothetical protein